ncbi:MAG TPA: DUF4129 domain-containing protein [Tahibacter sp.]|uniref:DUF4129 domain-containing protein n=1 Tax=Tahibacter sp. TaxID=2056211 RepID=UPI002CC8BC9F|nr:DUF4129 domain-containing protein [Tahibacter sp.]HSX61068.1 DUF4129 domain-containing protein [Tahibacter sp.]
MRLEGLTVALRQRSSWEATDLGVALARRHARTVWASWVVVTLPVFALLNLGTALIDTVWLASLLLWWLKPVFDRIPLFVLSRAVFGATPSVRDTVRAQRNWGWRPMLGWLTWRRLHPSRSLLMPVDLLEGLTGKRRGERVRVLQRAASGTSMLTTLIAANMDAFLSIAVFLLALMFVPVEFFTDAAQQFWSVLFENPPLWAQVLANFVAWLSMSLIEPFYVGAGFGLYLNRRTQLEAWDVELAFRRLAARLAGTAAALLPFVFGVLLLTATARADEPVAAGGAAAEPAAAASATTGSVDGVGGIAAESVAEIPADTPPQSLRRVFAGQYVDDGGFDASVKKAYEDDDLNPTTKEYVWEPRDKTRKERDFNAPRTPVQQWFEALGGVLAFIAENMLWILLALLVALLVRYHRVWLPWISERFERERTPDALAVHDIAIPEDVPDDVPGAVRALWRQDQQRAALALLYRAAVLRLDAALGTSLPPGATEAECLKRSRRLSDADYAQLFARIVRCWQAAAYAQRLPSAADVESLLGAWAGARSATA